MKTYWRIRQAVMRFLMDERSGASTEGALGLAAIAVAVLLLLQWLRY